MTQKARPAVDIFNDGWLPTPVTPQINEEEPDDDNFVTASPCGAEFTVRLARLASPVVGPDEMAHELTLRLEGPAYVLVELLQGDTLIAWDTFTPTAGFNDYTLIVTREEAAKIRYEPGPDGDPDLRVRVTAAEGSGSGLSSCVACLQRLYLTRDMAGYVTGVFYLDEEDELIEVLSCDEGEFAENSTCVVCLERLCVSRDEVGITGIFFVDNDSELVEVPTVES